MVFNNTMVDDTMVYGDSSEPMGNGVLENMLVELDERMSDVINRTNFKFTSIEKIRVENFMCHKHMEVDFHERVNFITGQNGSGKSAILTALILAFGTSARGTTRGTKMQDFIKTGERVGVIEVTLRNEGEEAYMHHLFGDRIIVRRRLTDTNALVTMKDSSGRVVKQGKDELNRLINHFNIDVVNPCVIMTQDKSREFLHSGNDKEKYMFFLKATMLDQLMDLAVKVNENLKEGESCCKKLETQLLPEQEEVKRLESRLKELEGIETLRNQERAAQKELVWAMVYDKEAEMDEHNQKIATFEAVRVKQEEQIRLAIEAAAAAEAAYAAKEEEIQGSTPAVEEIQREQEELAETLKTAMRLRHQLTSKKTTKEEKVAEISDQRQRLHAELQRVTDSIMNDTQADDSDRLERINLKIREIEEAKQSCEEAEAQERTLREARQPLEAKMQQINAKIRDLEGQANDTRGHVNRLENQQRGQNEVFGGERTTRLLREMSKRAQQFQRKPIGPIGAHIGLEEEGWDTAIEVVLGAALETWVVTSTHDMRLLRECAQQCNYGNINITQYDFNHPAYNLPPGRVPPPNLKTVLSILSIESPTISNVLIDQANIERTVLVDNYNAGVPIAYNNSYSGSVAQCITRDGAKMYTRGGNQGHVPLTRPLRPRLTKDVQSAKISAEKDLQNMLYALDELKGERSQIEAELQGLSQQMQTLRRTIIEGKRWVNDREAEKAELIHEREQETRTQEDVNGASTHELESEIRGCDHQVEKLESEIRDLEDELADVMDREKAATAKNHELSARIRMYQESSEAKEQELIQAREEMLGKKEDIKHYENQMQELGVEQEKVRLDLQEAEGERNLLADQAATKCQESELDPENQGYDAKHWQKKISKLKVAIEKETKRIPEDVDQIKTRKETLKQRVEKQKKKHETLKDRIKILKNEMKKRRQRIRECFDEKVHKLNEGFGRFMRMKGHTGSIEVDQDQQTLTLKVRMAGEGAEVMDTRTLSGGERSLSTLSFALALHDMTDAPFRAMDEFDVFMDDVTRKISMKTAVDFAIANERQWIFITPNDISSVEDNPEMIKKQVMQPPRG